MIDEYTRRERRRYLGSSDAAAVVGKDPWRSPADVFLEKTDRLAEERDPTPAIECGQYLEEGILDWAAKQLGLPALARDVSYLHPAHEMLAANLDAATPFATERTPEAIIEAKTSGLVGLGARTDEEWGHAGTDDVPTHVLIQVHHQFAVVNAQPGLEHVRTCWVPALLARRGLVMFRIERSDELVAALLEQELAFWHDFVAAGRMPPDSLPSFDVLRRLRREPQKTVEIDGALLEAWEKAKASKRTAEATEEQAKVALLAALGDGEAGTCALGTVSYLETTRAAYQVAASTYRTLRFKPAKTKTRRKEIAHA